MIATYPTISTSPDLAEIFPRKLYSTTFAKGKIIREHLDGIYHVNQGIVRTYRQLQDRKVHIDFFRQDEFFGEACLLPNAEDETAVAFSACEVARWERTEFEQGLGMGQRLSLIRMLGERAENRKNMLVNFQLTPLMLNRLCQILASLAGRIGQVCNNGDVVLPAITQGEIGSIIGSRREIISQHMNYLRRNVGVEYSRKGITLPAEFVTKWRVR